MNPLNCYLTASSRQKGALAIFMVYGEEPLLAATLDARIGQPPFPPRALRYGWLRDGNDEIIDEVMLACPAENQRTLMTHGGPIIRTQIEAYLETAGFAPAADLAELAGVDPLLDPFLPQCVTEGQAAAFLVAKENGAPPPVHVLTPKRILLAGAPNAGKSSLMNALSGYDRAFVDAAPGATRDIVNELMDICGYAVWLGDLPGYREAGDSLESEIWQKAKQTLNFAEEIWFVIDASEEWGKAADSAAGAIAQAIAGQGKSVLIILNKTDLPQCLSGAPWEKYFPRAPALSLNTLPDGNALDAVEAYTAL